MNRIIKITIASALLLLLTGCADYVTFQQAAITDQVGFWYGLWHGMTAPISFIGSLFSDSIAVYAIYNSGGWYDFGFLWGVGALTGGSAAIRK